MNFLIDSFYLSDNNNLAKAMELTDLSLDELELIVGRFSKNSWRYKQLRGEVIVDKKGVAIRHHFTKKILWRRDD
jgi:hypothetical protein